MSEMTPELLAQMLPEPFLTAEAGDTVIIFLAGIWDKEQAGSMVSYLMEWAPQVTWSVVQDPGFAGIVHVKGSGTSSQTPRP